VSDQDRQLERATATARAARSRLHATLGAIQRRLSPHSLVDDAWRKVRDKSVDIAGDTVSLAKRHPVETAAAAAVVTGVIARRPLAHALSRLFSRRKETSSDAAGSAIGSPGPDQS
jgi:hypothetical protein